MRSAARASTSSASSAPIVEEVGKALVVEAQRADVRLVVKGGDATAKVAGALDVSQVLTNLVLNALAYAPRGSAVDVTVTVDDERCTIVVADDGPGVAPERRESIFHGDSLRPGGTGVGLRHSRALARAWGGDVELLVARGQGSALPSDVAARRRRPATAGVDVARERAVRACASSSSRTTSP